MDLGLSAPSPDAPAVSVRPVSRELLRPPLTASVQRDSLSGLHRESRDARAREPRLACSSVQKLLCRTPCRLWGDVMWSSNRDLG